MVLGIVVLLVVVGVLLAAASVGLRWRVLRRSGAGIGCSVRRRSGAWMGGLARYDEDALRVFRSLGVGFAPTVSLPRTGLVITGRRNVGPAEARALAASYVIVECRVPERNGDGTVSDIPATPMPAGPTDPAAPVAGRTPAVLAGLPAAGGRAVELALPREAVLGLLAWLESAPPGAGLPQ